MRLPIGIRKAVRKDLSATTILIIAQRISSVQTADKIIVLDDGLIIGNGTHTELLDSCKPYQEIFYSQQLKETIPI